MADISKEELKKEIAAVLKGSDLATITAKKVRQEIEEKLEIDLTSRRKEVDDIVLQCMKENEKKGGKKPAPKKNGKGKGDEDDENDDDKDEDDDADDKDEDEEEEEEEENAKKPKRGAPKKNKRKKASSEESEDASEDKESDEEYSPNKKAKGGAKAKKGALKGRKKKGGSDSDSDEDWAKGKKGPAKKTGAKRGGGTGGYGKSCQLSPELAAVVGQESMARHEVVKKVWAIIKEKNLYDPKNKQFAICNDDLMKVIGIKRFRTFGMMKYLKKHFLD